MNNSSLEQRYYEMGFKKVAGMSPSNLFAALKKIKRSTNAFDTATGNIVSDFSKTRLALAPLALLPLTIATA